MELFFSLKSLNLPVCSLQVFLINYEREAASLELEKGGKIVGEMRERKRETEKRVMICLGFRFGYM